MGYSLTSNRVPQTQLWELATYELKPRLNRLNGVASIVVQGGEQPEFQVTPDPEKLLLTQSTVPDILDAVRRTNLIDSPGLLNRNHQLFLALVNGQTRNPAQIADIVIKKTKSGVPVRIRDVADVGPSVKPVYTIVTANGKPAVLININRQPDSNTVSVAQEVHAEMARLQQSLPPGVEVSSFYDQSVIVEESIRSVRDAILIGLVLASIILVLFLRDWGASVVAGLVIPVTVLVTFIALKALGESFNLMTLGGLAAAVGLVIDDAIVVVENITLHRDAGQGRLEAIDSALREITAPLIGSTITPVVVFLPLISITGVTGTFFRALAVTMTVSLFTSLGLALAWTPNLSQYFVRRKADPPTGSPRAAAEAFHPDHDPAPSPPGAATAIAAREDEMKRLMAAEEASMAGFFGRVIHFYERWMRRALEHPGWLALFSVALIVVSYFCYRALGSDLLPAMDEGGFIVDYITPAGSSLEETNRMVSHLEQIVRSIPEVASTSRRTGLQLGLAAVTEANWGDISVRLKQSRSRNIDDIISEARAQIAHKEPSVSVEFIQLLQDMIGDLTGAPQPIQIKLFSPDGQLLQQWAPRVADAISKIQIGSKQPMVDVLNGIENTISGPAVTFQVNPPSQPVPASHQKRWPWTPRRCSTANRRRPRLS